MEVPDGEREVKVAARDTTGWMSCDSRACPSYSPVFGPVPQQILPVVAGGRSKRRPQQASPKLAAGHSTQTCLEPFLCRKPLVMLSRRFGIDLGPYQYHHAYNSPVILYIIAYI